MGMGLDENKIAEKVRAFHDEAITRDRTLCTFSKDSKFCPLLRVKIENQGNAAMCSVHQNVPRYVFMRLRSEKKADDYAKRFRLNGYNANVWQTKHVVIGPTSLPTNIFNVTGLVGELIECMMYEDVLMLAIKQFEIDLSHIVGQKGNPHGY
jgi:hypothetical protein